jgi:hypothetical protein
VTTRARADCGPAAWHQPFPEATVHGLLLGLFLQPAGALFAALIPVQINAGKWIRHLCLIKSS